MKNWWKTFFIVNETFFFSLVIAFFCSKTKQCPCIDTTINCSDQDLTTIPDGIEDQILRMYVIMYIIGRHCLVIYGQFVKPIMILFSFILYRILKGNRIGQNLTLDMFNRLTRMHMIDLTDNDISFIPPGLFRKLWKLRVL